jgi:hypothetical protein
MNEGKFAEIVDLFTAEGELEFGPLCKAKGRDGIIAFFKRLGPAPAAGSGAAPSGPHFSYVKVHP